MWDDMVDSPDKPFSLLSPQTNFLPSPSSPLQRPFYPPSSLLKRQSHPLLLSPQTSFLPSPSSPLNRTSFPLYPLPSNNNFNLSFLSPQQNFYPSPSSPLKQQF